MSIVNIALNTETKECVVTVDGVSVPGTVRSARVYVDKDYRDEKHCEVCVTTEGENVGDLSQVTNLCAYAGCAEKTIGKSKDIYIAKVALANWAKFIK